MFSFKDVIFYFPWEKEFILWFQNLGSGTIINTILNVLNNIFSACGEEIACIFVMGIIYWGLDKQKGKKLGLAVFTGSLGVSMIKNIFCRLRPFVAIPEIKNLRDVDGYSFPSGHSTNISCVSYSVGKQFNLKTIKPILIVLPLLVGLSRTFVGAHYPTDVMVGLLLGTCSAFLINKIYNQKNQHIVNIAITSFALIGLFYCKTTDYYSSLGMLIGYTIACFIEEKYVDFENTNNIFKIILRLLGGFIIYFVLMKILKSIFNTIADPASTLGLYLRTIRYALVIFIELSLYPLLFKFENKLFKK